MDQVFPGFAEAMTRMQEGGEYRFTMPQRLAFGAQPAAAAASRRTATLDFEVRVRKIVRGGAAMMQQQAAQQQQQQQQAPQQ